MAVSGESRSRRLGKGFFDPLAFGVEFTIPQAQKGRGPASPSAGPHQGLRNRFCQLNGGGGGFGMTPTGFSSFRHSPHMSDRGVQRGVFQDGDLGDSKLLAGFCIYQPDSRQFQKISIGERKIESGDFHQVIRMLFSQGCNDQVKFGVMKADFFYDSSDGSGFSHGFGSSINNSLKGLILNIERAMFQLILQAART